MVLIGEVVFTGEPTCLIQRVVNRNTMNQNSAIKLSRIVIEACGVHHPVVPRRGVPLPSILKTRPGKPKGVAKRFKQYVVDGCSLRLDAYWRDRRGASRKRVTGRVG